MGNEYEVLEGSVHKRKDGRYETRLYIDGKQVTTACRKLKKDAIAIHNAIVRELRAARKTIVPKKLTFKNWLEDWFFTFKKDKIKSWKNIETKLRLYIYPNCPDIDLCKVNDLVVTKLLNELPTDNIKYYCYTIIHDALRRAYINQKLKFDVSVTLTRPEYDPEEGRALPQQEINQLFSIAPKKYLFACKLFLATGCRARELLERMHTLDFNAEKNTIVIHGTKSDASEDRIIPFFDPIKKLFAEYKIDLSANTLITDVTYSAMKSWLRRLKENNILDINIKDFRTTFATRCAELGVPRAEAAKWLGNKIETMEKYYIKVLSENEALHATKVVPY